MKKFLSVLLASVLAVFMLAACSTASSSLSTAATEKSDASVSTQSEEPASISITHSLGTIEVAVNPARIAVFDFGSLDTIDALGINAELAVPKSSLPAYLGKYDTDAYTDLGGVKDFDIEAVNAFAPDLIIISGRQQDSYADLSAIAPTLYIELDSTKYMEDFSRNAAWIGQIFDQTEAVEAAMVEIQAKIDATKAVVAENSKNALIILTNDGSISAYGPGSRFGIIHDTLGVPAADTEIEVSTHGQEVNYEYIAAKNPDILFVVDRTVVVGGENTAEKTLDNPLVNDTNAAKNGKIISLNPDIWYLSGGGLASVSMMCDDVLSAIDA